MFSWGCRFATSIILATYWLRRADPLHLSQFPSTRSRLYFFVMLLVELCVESIPYSYPNIHVYVHFRLDFFPSLFSGCNSRLQSVLSTPRHTRPTCRARAPRPPSLLQARLRQSPISSLGCPFPHGQSPRRLLSSGFLLCSRRSPPKPTSPLMSMRWT